MLTFTMKSIKPAIAVTGMLTLSLGIGAMQARSADKDEKSTTPAAVQGRWIATTTGATTYWDNNGRYVGGGSGTGQLYEFDGKGNFTYYLIMEMRTGSMLTRARNNYKGKVTFDGDSFTLKLTSGQFCTDTNSGTSERAMNSADLKRLSRNYKWRIEKGDDGKPRFIVPFSDGSKYEFKPIK